MVSSFQWFSSNIIVTEGKFDHRYSVVQLAMPKASCSYVHMETTWGVIEYRTPADDILYGYVCIISVTLQMYLSQKRWKVAVKTTPMRTMCLRIEAFKTAELLICHVSQREKVTLLKMAEQGLWYIICSPVCTLCTYTLTFYNGCLSMGMKKLCHSIILSVFCQFWLFVHNKIAVA